MSYLISYDLNAPGKNYDQLYDAIKSLGGWWHHLDSTWIVTHAGPATAIRDKLKPYLDHNDKLLVVHCSGEAAWTGFNSSGSQWLKDHL